PHPLPRPHPPSPTRRSSDLHTLARLRDLGNTVIVVEHDEDAIRHADHVVDLGPGAGVHGGEVIAQGTPAEIAKNPSSITGQYLSDRKSTRLNSSHVKISYAV